MYRTAGPCPTCPDEMILPDYDGDQPQDEGSEEDRPRRQLLGYTVGRVRRTDVRLAIACALAVVLAGCATRDIDECRKGDRRRCPGDASSSPERVLKAERSSDASAFVVMSVVTTRGVVPSRLVGIVE